MAIVVLRVQKLIQCAVRHWSVDGGAAKALAVADCESGFSPWAANGSSRGVFQQNVGPDDRWWISRAITFLRPRWFPFAWEGVRDHGWYRARANVLLSIRQANRFGWGAWACA